MAKGNCSGCLQKLRNTQNRLAQRKDGEAKAKKVEQETIARWESKINSTPSQCICSEDFPTPICLGGTEYNCDKCVNNIIIYNTTNMTTVLRMFVNKRNVINVIILLLNLNVRLAKLIKIERIKSEKRKN